MRFPSSIFSFDTLAKGAVGVPVAALVALGFVIGVELALHAFEDSLPEPVLWSPGEVSVKIAQVQARGESGKGPLDVLVIGPSHASVGVSPRAMAEVMPGSPEIYNGGLNGRGYEVLDFILEQVYLPVLRPRLLVVSVSPIFFNRNRPLLDHNTMEFFSSPMPRALTSKGWPGAWRRFLVEDLYLYRYRRRSTGLSEGYSNGARLVDEFGFHGVVGVFDDTRRAELRSEKHGYRDVWDRYEFGGTSAEAFETILKRACADRIPVVVVNMPFRPELLTMEPGGELAYDRFLDGMMAMQRVYGFHWHDFQQGLTFDDDDFRDVDHLNQRGAARLSSSLAQVVSALPSADAGREVAGDDSNGSRSAGPNRQGFPRGASRTPLSPALHVVE